MNRKQFSLSLILIGTLLFSVKAQDVIVQTEAGKVRGQINKGVAVFKNAGFGEIENRLSRKHRMPKAVVVVELIHSAGLDLVFPFDPAQIVMESVDRVLRAVACLRSPLRIAVAPVHLDEVFMQSGTFGTHSLSFQGPFATLSDWLF